MDNGGKEVTKASEVLAEIEDTSTLVTATDPRDSEAIQAPADS